MNENKRIDTSNKNRKVRWRTQDENMHWIITKKKNNGPSFQNSQLLNWSLPTEEFSQLQGQNRPVANLLVIDFRSQPRDMPSLKQVTVCKRYGFFSVLAAIVRKNYERRETCQQLIGDIKRTFFFSRVLSQLS